KDDQGNNVNSASSALRLASTMDITELEVEAMAATTIYDHLWGKGESLRALIENDIPELKLPYGDFWEPKPGRAHFIKCLSLYHAYVPSNPSNPFSMIFQSTSGPDESQYKAWAKQASADFLHMDLWGWPECFLLS